MQNIVNDKVTGKISDLELQESGWCKIKQGGGECFTDEVIFE